MNDGPWTCACGSCREPDESLSPQPSCGLPYLASRREHPCALLNCGRPSHRQSTRRRHSSTARRHNRAESSRPNGVFPNYGSSNGYREHTTLHRFRHTPMDGHSSSATRSTRSRYTMDAPTTMDSRRCTPRDPMRTRDRRSRREDTTRGNSSRIRWEVVGHQSIRRRPYSNRLRRASLREGLRPCRRRRVLPARIQSMIHAARTSRAACSSPARGKGCRRAEGAVR